MHLCVHTSAARLKGCAWFDAVGRNSTKRLSCTEVGVLCTVMKLLTLHMLSSLQAGLLSLGFGSSHA